MNSEETLHKKYNFFENSSIKFVKNSNFDEVLQKNRNFKGNFQQNLDENPDFILKIGFDEILQFHWSQPLQIAQTPRLHPPESKKTPSNKRKSQRKIVHSN